MEQLHLLFYVFLLVKLVVSLMNSNFLFIRYDSFKIGWLVVSFVLSALSWNLVIILLDLIARNIQIITSLFDLSMDVFKRKRYNFFPFLRFLFIRANISFYRRVAESFSGRVHLSKFKAGLLKYCMLDLISDLFKAPSFEYMCK